ncbi:hypothetical protein ACR6C2_36305 [Streptomyces sp. INA 01156]
MRAMARPEITPLDEDEDEDEDEDAYMIAVTCRRRGCPRPRTGVIVHRADVLEP